MSIETSAQNPMSEYLLKIQTIISNTEFKDKAESLKYETLESKEAGGVYVRAITKTDIFESYTYNSKEVYKYLLKVGFDENKIFYFIENPQIIPQTLKDEMMNIERLKVISNYVEKNKYYVRLSGKPFTGNKEYPPERILLIPDDFFNMYKMDNAIQRNQPIHEMPVKYQELFMNSIYYKKMISENPDSQYLLYIGTNAIPIHVARRAQDGDILRINTNKLSTYSSTFGNITVSPDIVHTYVNIYKETRDYIYYTLRGDYSSIFPNYDNFIRFLTIYMSIGNTLNEFMKKSTSMIYMNNVTANNFFMLYGLPSVIMEGSSREEFLKKFRMLLMDKGTNVVYRVKDLIGYEYTDIYTLVMVKQQVFENGIPLYYYDEDGNKQPKQNIVFRRLGTSDDNTSYFKFRESTKTYTVDEITSGDPRWWNTPEVEQMLSDMNYTLSNSKYIQLSTHLSMTDIWWQSVILLRGLLDRKQETQFTELNINFNINNTSDISIFEAVLILVILMNWQLKDVNNREPNGDLYLPNGTYDGKAVCLDLIFNGLNDDGSPKELLLGTPYKISAFNFRIREDDRDFYLSISDLDYIEPDVFLPMLDKVLDREDINLGEVMMTDIKLIYNYLESKLRDSKSIYQFRQVTDVFNHLFLVDPIRNEWYDGLSFDIDDILINRYTITLGDLYSLKSFFKEDDDPQITITFNNVSYPISLYYVLNKDIYTIKVNDIYPFKNNDFVDLFISNMRTFSSYQLMNSNISESIKNNYQNIIIDKVELDVGNTVYGPKTFESLLFRHNPDLYRYITTLKETPENILLLMRAIIKALESYTNSSLYGLEFSAVGVDEYFRILKEVISYFKSYMVEFTKDEFRYIFDGLFDAGGNSNMLRLYDTMASGDMNFLPKESLTLYDVSSAERYIKMTDDNIGLMYDEAIFRHEATYQTLLDTGYEIWYDDGNTITQTPFEISPDTRVIANISQIPDSNPVAYKIIININNLDVIPPNYVGNNR